jgi:hypothetical protein
MEQSQQIQPDPTRIMQVGMGFWASKALLAAVHFKLFTLLAGGKKMSGKAIKNALHLKTITRHILDWLDVLTMLGFLNREGLFTEAVYTNNTDAEVLLDRDKPGYMGGVLEMANNRLYKFWGDLEEGLYTGLPQNETKTGLMGESFSSLYSSPEKLQEFMDAMSGIQTGNFITLAKKFDFSEYRSLADIGGADAWLSIRLCLQYPRLCCINFDMPEVKEIAQKKIAHFHLDDRIKFLGGDFIKDDLPAAEVITMGNVIHGLNEDNKQKLIRKAFDVLPANGVLIAIENLIDESRSQNLFGLLMSLNMLIENGDAFDYMPSDFNRWTKQAGFTKTAFIPLTGPATAAIAYK